MKLSTVGRDQLKNVTQNTNTRAQTSAKERNMLVAQLNELAPEEVILFEPEMITIKKRDGTTQEKPETVRGLRLRVSKAAKAAGINDVQYGSHSSGALAVWRDASAAKKTRGSKNGKAEEAPVAVPA